MLYVFVVMPSAYKLVKTADDGGDQNEDTQRQKNVFY